MLLDETLCSLLATNKLDAGCCFAFPCCIRYAIDKDTLLVQASSGQDMKLVSACTGLSPPDSVDSMDDPSS